MQRYRFTIEHVPGNEIAAANALQRMITLAARCFATFAAAAGEDPEMPNEVFALSRPINIGTNSKEANVRDPVTARLRVAIQQEASPSEVDEEFHP